MNTTEKFDLYDAAERQKACIKIMNIMRIGQPSSGQKGIFLWL